jgi:hypothetical protein
MKHVFFQKDYNNRYFLWKVKGIWTFVHCRELSFDMYVYIRILHTALTSEMCVTYPEVHVLISSCC